MKKKIAKCWKKTQPFLLAGYCPTKEVLAGSMDKWAIFVLFNLGYHEVLRFNQLKNNIEGISARMLTVTLKRLERNGMLIRKVYPEVPPKVEYRLTDFGFELTTRLVELTNWFLDNMPDCSVAAIYTKRNKLS
ncbi:MAG: helix-turn-helix domain-containing protein [Bacteroidota bacterium]